MYIADSQNERIRYVNTSGIITPSPEPGRQAQRDGTLAIAATFGNPVAVALDASGAVYVADENNNRIRRFFVGGAVTTFAGTAVSVGDGGQSPQAVLSARQGRRWTRLATCTSPTKAPIGSAR